MEKVKITPEQAKEIEEISEGSQPFIVSYHAKGILAWEHLSELSLDELIRALYIGYEVEPEFKVGDWVVNANGTIGKITNINEFGEFEGFWEKTEMLCEKDNFVRHATPEEIAEEKERRWWAKHGRNLWELRKGDILINNGNDVSYQIVGVHKNGDIAFEHDTDYRDKSIIRNNYKVACFAEQRLDREGE